VSRPGIGLSFNDNIGVTVLTDLASSSSAETVMSTTHHSRGSTLCDLPALSFSTSVHSWSLFSGSETASSGHCEFEEFMLWRRYASRGGRAWLYVVGWDAKEMRGGGFATAACCKVLGTISNPFAAASANENHTFKNVGNRQI
jgi:hypothetical protein